MTVLWAAFLALAILFSCALSIIYCCRKRVKRLKPDPDKVSKLEALKEGNRLRLFKVERDKRTHVPVLGTEQLFEMWDSNKDVGRESIGLGLYFFHMIQFLIILLLLSGLSIVNVARYNEQLAFSESYALRFDDSSGAPMREDVRCTRLYNVKSWITVVSAGALCVKEKSSNPYFCPATCTVTVADEDLSALNLTDTDKALCSFHRPCSIENSELCCENELSPENRDDVPALTVWIWVGSVLLFTVWIMVNRLLSNKLAKKLNSSVITAADYTIIVEGLDKEGCSRKELEEFFSHYGSISWCTPVPRVGAVIEKRQEQERLQVLLLELDEHTNRTLDYTVSGILFSMVIFGVPFFLRSMWTSFEDAIDRQKAAVKARLKALDSEIFEARVQALRDLEDGKNTGEGLVTFSYEDFAKNAVEDHYRPLQKPLRELLCNSVYPYPVMKDKDIKVERAPEPTDYRWENSNCFWRDHNLRVFYSNCLTVLLLGGAAAAQYFLERYKVEAMNDFSNYRVAGNFDEGEYWAMRVKVRALTVSMACGKYTVFTPTSLSSLPLSLPPSFSARACATC